MCEHIAEQVQIAEDINRQFANFKKDSANRKTQSYLNKRLDSLNNLWEKFNENNKNIEKDPKAKEEQYTAFGYFRKTKNIYVQYREKLIELLEAFNEESENDSVSEEQISKNKKESITDNSELTSEGSEAKQSTSETNATSKTRSHKKVQVKIKK